MDERSTMQKAIISVFFLWLLFGTGCNTLLPSGSATDVESTEALPRKDVRSAAEPPISLTVSSMESSQVGLVSWIDVQTDVPTWLAVSVEDLATGQTTQVPTPIALSAEHLAVVMGLSASSSYQVNVTATNVDGLSTTGGVVVHTEPLPDLIAGLEVSLAAPESMQPGYTLLAGSCGGELFWVALDNAGEVVFFILGADEPNVPIPGGNYLVGMGHGGPLVITDLTGQVKGATLQPAEFGTPAFHHTPGISPEGNYLAIGVEMRVIDGYSDGEAGTTAYNIVGDVFYEVDPLGELVRKTALLDILDPLRIGGDFHNGFWDLDFPEAQGGTKDWSHSNSIRVDPVDGNYVASVLSQSWVVKLDRISGALLWRLGEDGDFQLAPGGRWASIHHSAVPLDGNRILLYDNYPSDPPHFSRAVEYALDTENWVATQTWEYQMKPGAFSSSKGEVHKLANGNILFCDSALPENPDIPEGPTWARVVEVTYPAPSKEVFRMAFRPVAEQANGEGCRIDTAHRIPSLY